MGSPSNAPNSKKKTKETKCAQTLTSITFLLRLLFARRITASFNCIIRPLALLNFSNPYDPGTTIEKSL